MIRTFTKITVPVIAGGLAFGLFPVTKSQFINHHTTTNEQCLKAIQSTSLYQTLDDDANFTRIDATKQFPKQHLKNYVSSGLLFGKDLFETQPIIFNNVTSGEFVAIHYIGKKLTSDDGKIHNGITSTLLDEGLCAAGFQYLPSKKGVTAKLSIDFKNQVPPNAIVAVKANVVEHRGRKVIINGSLETLTPDNITIATANCVLVEPKWFKYFAWLQFI